MRGGDRIGVYYLEQGASQRAGKVIYDRAHSAIAEAQPGDFDWAAIFAGRDWFHWSGITPALSESAAAVTAEACREAKRLGLTVSFDLNYRAKLWTRERAGAVLAPLMPHVDLCVTSVEEARTVFGLALDDAAPNREEDAARRLQERFGFKSVALTMRQADTASATSWGAMLFADGRAHFSRRHEITIVDRVGAGDSFTGALIFALRRGDAPQRAHRVRRGRERAQAHHPRRLLPGLARRGGSAGRRCRRRARAAVRWRPEKSVCKRGSHPLFSAPQTLFMAKTCWLEREKRKAATVAKYAALRAELKAKGDYIGLSQLPRNASPVRMSRRCHGHAAASAPTSAASSSRASLSASWRRTG